MSNQTTYKLYYFNIRGRGEVDRLVLVAAGQQFDDVRFEDAEWPKYKPKSPSGKCPFLEETTGSDVFMLTQSLSIARYLAKKFDLAGKGEPEMALVEAMGDQVMDLQEDLIRTRMEHDEKRKVEIVVKFNHDTIPHNLELFERNLIKSKSGFLFPSGLTWPDLHLMNVIEWFDEPQQAILERYPLVKEHYERVRSLPRIAEWISKRPVTEI